jgi:hypothetical protein
MKVIAERIANGAEDNRMRFRNRRIIRLAYNRMIVHEIFEQNFKLMLVSITNELSMNTLN